MKFTVSLSPVARADLDRIDDFLAARSLDVARRAAGALEQAIMSLSTLARRGRKGGPDFRELIVPFGKGNYVVRYRVKAGNVLVTRIFHSLEDRPLA